MSPHDSVSVWIAGLKGNESDSAQKLWARYASRLVELARRKLGSAPKGIADEEDIAQSVFRSMCRGAASGRFNEVTCRDDLWWLLLAITRQKVVDHIRRETAQKRGGGRVRNSVEGTFDPNSSHRFTFDALISDEPTPEFLAIMEDENQRLLGLLRDDRLRHVANARIEGYTVAEIATELGISTRSVERKLRLIRDEWASDFSSANTRP